MATLKKENYRFISGNIISRALIHVRLIKFLLMFAFNFVYLLQLDLIHCAFYAYHNYETLEPIVYMYFDRLLTVYTLGE